MKLAAVTTDHTHRLYLNDSNDYTLTTWDREPNVISRFNINAEGRIEKVNFSELSTLNQEGIKWAQIQIASGKKYGTWLI